MVKIVTLGDFKIFVDDENILNKINVSSNQGLLLQYLIANINKQISYEEITKILWEKDKDKEAIIATKALVSLLQSELSRYGLADCLLIRKEYCAWALIKGIQLDTDIFNQYYKQLQKPELPSELRCSIYENVLYIYAGEVMSNAGNADWARKIRAEYISKYIKCVHQYTDILSEMQLHTEIVRVCKIAIEKAPLDTIINIKLMQALADMDRLADALLQYENVTNLFYLHYGDNLPTELLEFYKVLVKKEKSAKTTIDDIFNELENDNEDEGAFVCDYSIFKYIYKLYLRNLKRLDASCFVVLVRIQSLGSNAGPIETDRAMRRLCGILQDNLRTGDAISRQSLHCYALLLPKIESIITCKLVIDRIKARFYKDVENAKFTLDYKVNKVKEKSEETNKNV